MNWLLRKVFKLSDDAMAEVAISALLLTPIILFYIAFHVYAGVR